MAEPGRFTFPWHTPEWKLLTALFGKCASLREWLLRLRLIGWRE